MEFKVVWSERAIADLDEATRHLAEAAADRLGRAILRQVGQLGENPRAGSILPRQGDPDYRRLIEPPYWIVHEVSDRDRTVTILRVWHAALGLPQF